MVDPSRINSGYAEVALGVIRKLACALLAPVVVLTLVTTDVAFAQLEVPKPLFNRPHTGLNTGIDWRQWSAETIQAAQSRRQHLLVFLKADWSSDSKQLLESTFEDPTLSRYIRTYFTPVSVDLQQWPDLYQRWSSKTPPAIVLLNYRLQLLAVFHGYRQAPWLYRTLARIVRNPRPISYVKIRTAERSSDTLELGEIDRRNLLARFYADRDWTGGGKNSEYKRLDFIDTLLALELAVQGDQKAKELAQLDLSANLQLFDPVWGGVYLASQSGRWDDPRYEKLLSTQAENILLYVQAWRLFGDDLYRKAAISIAKYSNKHLKSTDGMWYFAQNGYVDGDVSSKDYFTYSAESRLKFGTPARTAVADPAAIGLYIQALCALYEVTDRSEYLSLALQSAQWCLDHLRSGQDGLFISRSHDPKVLRNSVPTLAGQLHMLGALLALHEASLGITVTSDKGVSWLTEAQTISKQIAQSFYESDSPSSREAEKSDEDPVRNKLLPGAFSVEKQKEEVLAPERNPELNALLVVHLKRLLLYRPNQSSQELIDSSLSFLTHSSTIEDALAVDATNQSALLLASFIYKRKVDEYFVVAAPGDETGLELKALANNQPGSLKRVEWYRPEDNSSIDNLNVAFPASTHPALYLCHTPLCTRAVRNTSEFPEAVKELEALE